MGSSRCWDTRPVSGYDGSKLVLELLPLLQRHGLWRDKCKVVSCIVSDETNFQFDLCCSFFATEESLDTRRVNIISEYRFGLY